MMQIIHCESCGGDIIPLNSVSVDLTLNKHVRCCDHCNRTETQKQNHFFCSLMCFHDFMNKAVTGETELKWKELFPPVSISVKKESSAVFES